MSAGFVWIAAIAVAVLVTVAWFVFKKKVGPRIPDALRPGRPLPDFPATDEQGRPIRSTQVIGSPTVMLFVRGNWCPFCSRQVENLTKYYKDIVDAGAKLVFVTPKPLETTRRVAEIFQVEFEFWMDDELGAAKQLGLVMPAGVPEDHRNEYGPDTIWPTALVIDSGGIIRFAKLSRLVIDRPDPKRLLRELRRLQEGST